MTFIPDNKIDEIRERADIVQIVSEYVSLKKAGRNHKGLCPFHSEKTPSFTVSEDKQIFYCFGCHAGGDVFAFLMKHENMSFNEVVNHLAKRYGIEIELDSQRVKESKSQKEIMFSINHMVSEFFIKNLSQDSKPAPAGIKQGDAQNARDYLKKRGLTDEVIKEFKIGYAPNSWDGVLNFLKYKKSPLDIAEKLGLIIKKNDRYYDRFRNRLMFPILDVQGRIIGFGARTLGNDDAKYINSPESEIFKKGEVFYGIYQAKASASKQGFVLVVEGYFDLIALHQYGFKNSIATMGTALTEVYHLEKLRPYAKELYPLFDGDDAGRRAALRSIPFFLDKDVKAKIVLIPRGMDPDDLLRKHGKETMEKCIKDAQPFMDFLLDEIKKKFDTSSSRGKIAFIEEAGQYISKVKNNLERDFYIGKIAHAVQVGTDVVLSAVIKEMSTAKKHETHIKLSSKETISIKELGIKVAEETILKILMTYPNLYNEKISDVINVFRESTLKEIGMFLVKNLNADRTLQIADLTKEVSDENMKKWLIKTSVSDNEEIKEHPEKILEDCCRTVITNNVDKEKKEEAKALLKRYH